MFFICVGSISMNNNEIVTQILFIVREFKIRINEKRFYAKRSRYRKEQNTQKNVHAFPRDKTVDRPIYNRALSLQHTRTRTPKKLKENNVTDY